jgi:hypothetical protein
MIQLSKLPRNKPGIYKEDLTAGSLKLPESRIVADLLLRNVGPEEWKQAIYSENVLQSKTSETSRRLANLIRSRLQTMEPPLWKLVPDGKGNVAMHTSMTLKAFVALCSAVLGKPIQQQIVVLGSMSLGGNVVPVENLAESLQVAADSGAKRILLPMASVRDIPTIPGELFAKFQTSFYADPRDAAFKALGVG